MTLAYLNSEYPSLSHTFIEREVRGLRERGVDIRTYTVRPATVGGRAGTANAAAAAETVALQAGVVALARDVLAGLIASPAGTLRASLRSQRLSPPGLSTRLRHLAYVVQGIRLARLLGAAGIRHVHVHMANNSAAIAMMACEFDPRLSYSLSIHGSAEFFHVDSWTLKEKAEAAAFVRCISHFCRAQVMAWTNPAAWDRFTIVRCGIPADTYAPRASKRTGPLRMITVGRLHPIKGYDVLLRACRLVLDRGLDLRVEMVGDGPMRSRLARQIQELQLQEHVALVGAVDQDRIGEYYDRADLMVVSSFMEGVPVVLMEAMAKELAVISTRVGGVPELVEDGVSGRLVHAGCIDSLADAIAHYAAVPDLCRQDGRAGRARVLEAYTIECTADNMLDLFRSHGLALESVTAGSRTPIVQETAVAGA